jgi:hypothetical protein
MTSLDDLNDLYNASKDSAGQFSAALLFGSDARAPTNDSTNNVTFPPILNISVDSMAMDPNVGRNFRHAVLDVICML